MTHDHHYAVVVGINDYPAITRLTHARNDANEFADWLESPTGGHLRSGQVKRIVSDDENALAPSQWEAKPVADQVWKALDEARKDIGAKIDADPDVFEHSRLYFFVSGHGIALGGNDAALLMANAGGGMYDFNVSCGEILEYFELRHHFKEIVVFADCCRQVADESCRGGRPPFERQKRNFGAVRKVWGYATQYHDVALEPGVSQDALTDDARHGYFTRALLAGLRGEAANPSTGRIDGASLKAYLVPRVEALTRGRQRPQVVAPDEILFGMGHAPLREVRLHFPAGFTGEVILTRGLSDVVERRVIGASPWVVELTDELYRVKPSSGGTTFAGGGMFAVEGADRDVQL